SWCSAFPRDAQWPGRPGPSLLEHPHRLTVAGAAQVGAAARSLFPFSPAWWGGNPNRTRMIRVCRQTGPAGTDAAPLQCDRREPDPGKESEPCETPRPEGRTPPRGREPAPRRRTPTRMDGRVWRTDPEANSTARKGD